MIKLFKCGYEACFVDFLIFRRMRYGKGRKMTLHR